MSHRVRPIGFFQDACSHFVHFGKVDLLPGQLPLHPLAKIGEEYLVDDPSYIEPLDVRADFLLPLEIEHVTVVELQGTPQIDIE